MQTFTVTLTAPNGETSNYTVTAKNKTEARKKVGDLYRRDTPSARHGFYSFNQQRLTWDEEAE